MSATLDLVKDPVTTKAAAEMLDVSRSAVLKAIKKTKLTAEQFGRDYAIERDEVERYRRERKMTGPRRTRPRAPGPASED
jgi:excisionase family DNA binding protein